MFDLGFQATKVAVFAADDHGPLPQETIESTVYLSNNQVDWILAVVQRVWLQGHVTDGAQTPGTDTGMGLPMRWV